VDDEPDIRTSVKEMLDASGFQTTVASNADEAFKALEKGKFDLLVLDIFMPKVSGRQLLEKIRANKKLSDQKVIFLTAAQLTETGEKKIKGLKPLAYIVKPIEVDKFLKKVKEILA
jgi:DNA-binding response OmpR family regulator